MVHGDHGAAIFTVINALSYSPSYVGKYASTMEHVGNMKMDVPKVIQSCWPFFRMETAVVIHLLKVKVGWCRTDEPKFISTAITGWWFGTWLLFSIIYGIIFFHILGMSSSQLTIFQRGRSTTNQGKMMVVNQWLWGTCSDKAVFAYTFTYFYRVYFLWRKVSIWSDRKTALVAEICHGCRWGRQLLL